MVKTFILLMITLLLAPAILFAQVPADLVAKATNSAIIPVPREDAWWKDRHNSMNERVKKGNVDMIFIGDSITHGWEGDGKEVWAQYYAKRNAVNLGISGDQTQHVLWRLENGNIDNISPKLAVIMIGTNNCGANSAEEIGEGITTIVTLLREKLPTTKILILAIFPCEEKPGPTRDKLAQASQIAAKITDGKMVQFMDIGKNFLQADGTLSKEIMPDFLHPNNEGYKIWAKSIEPKIVEMMGEKK